MGLSKFQGAKLAQLVECQTLDHKVVGLNLTRGEVLCPLSVCLRLYILVNNFTVILGWLADMTEKLLTGM